MTAFGTARELALTRVLDAPRDKLYRCWTEPELMKQWFAPLPYTTPHVETELRAGESSYIIMRSPDGTDMPMRGVYLEVVPNERIVFTDAFVRAWEPAEKPFFTGIIEFADNGDGRTRYTATARHWTAENCKAHEEMGFHQGWGQCADQLEALAKRV